MDRSHMLLLWQTWTYFSDLPDAASIPKYKQEFKTSTQHLCAEFQNAEL